MEGRASYEEIRQAAANIKGIADNLQREIDEFVNISNNIGEGGSSWSGQAAEEAKHTIQALKAKIDELHNQAIAFSAQANAAVNNYEAADQASRSEMQSI